MTDRLLSRPEAADLLGVPPKTLAEWAYRGTGPAFYRVGKATRYRIDDLEAWLETVRVEPRANGREPPHERRAGPGKPARTRGGGSS